MIAPTLTAIIKDSNVCQALNMIIEKLSHNAVIRSIDSSRNLEDLVKIMTYNNIKFSLINENLCLNNKELKECIKKGLFMWFDEVWLFESQFPSISLASVPYSTGDAMAYRTELYPQVLKTFENVNCDLLLADGADLCIVAREKDLIDFVTSSLKT